MCVNRIILQYKTSEFIDSTMHGWFNYVIYCSQIVTLSGDQHEVFESLVLQSLLQRPISGNPTVKRSFSFSTFDFNGLINVYTNVY